MRMAEKISRLFDYAVAHPDGFTRYDVQSDLGWPHKTFLEVSRALRKLFSDDTITLKCEPDGLRKAWRYKLIGAPDELRVWSANRTGDLETRLETMQAMATSMVNASDGRTIEGRKARAIHRYLTRLLEDLSEIGATAS